MSDRNNNWFFGSLYKTTVQVLDIFDNFKVKRYNKAGDVVTEQKVGLKYYPKKKVYMDLADPKC